MNQQANKLNFEPEADEDNNNSEENNGKLQERAQQDPNSQLHDQHRHHLRQRKGLDWGHCSSRDHQRREAAVFQAANQEEEVGSSSGHRLRSKFTKSKSSPSSLTTHKFGLRPTPSPPRLIIDHQTGDIVESYPEQPVFLRTYQPIEPDADEDDDDHEGGRHFEPMSDTTSANSVDHRLVSQAMPQQQQQRPDEMMNQHNHAKVYFAPPATGSGRPEQPAMSSRERARASFRHAIRQLAAEERTDIAIVTEPDDYDRSGEPTASRSSAAKPLGQMRITATSASQGEALLADRRNQPAARQQPMSSAASKLYSQPSLRRKQDGATNKTRGSPLATNAPKEAPPAQSSIEDLGLYGWCFSFRVLLVLLISGSIIYLLAVSLHADCARFKPAYTYVSLITASVNIISVSVFSLFWFCKGVTRHLYQDISASAFIATFYSILVCVNLALGIVFFFTDTCHYERTMALRSAWDHTDNTNELNYREQPDHERHSRGLVDSTDDTVSEPNFLDAMLTDPVGQQRVPPATTTPTTTPFSPELNSHGHLPQMSPLEAFWAYLKELARSFAKALYRFLIYYDLKFIGGLHALLAVCLQYLAIKVAVVRTHFDHSPLVEDV